MFADDQESYFTACSIDFFLGPITVERDFSNFVDLPSQRQKSQRLQGRYSFYIYKRKSLKS